MIVWGSSDNLSVAGERYDPATDGWTPLSPSGDLTSRWLHTAVWTGSQMIVWGGDNTDFGSYDGGGTYTPAVDSWVPVSSSGAPASRIGHTAVWTGSAMLVWGGYGSSNSLNNGGSYQFGNIAPGTVGPAEIAAGGVQSSSIAAGAVQSQNIAAGAVTDYQIANGAVGSAALAPNLTLAGTMTANAFTGDGSGLLNLNAANLTGTITTLGGLIIENRTTDPPAPATGQIWLRTDLP
jgi:hypothetical protein